MNENEQSQNRSHSKHTHSHSSNLNRNRTGESSTGSKTGSGFQFHLTEESSMSSKKSSGFHCHLEPLNSSETSLNSEKNFKAIEARSKKVKNPQQQQISKPEVTEYSPDSYQISDKLVGRDVNLDNNNDLDEYTYEYIADTDPRFDEFQQGNKPNLDNNSEYSYTYEYQSDFNQIPENNYRDRNVPNNYDRNVPNNYNRSQPNRYDGRIPDNYERNIPNNYPRNNNNNNDDDDDYTYTYDPVDEDEGQPYNPNGENAVPQSPHLILRVPRSMLQRDDEPSANDYTYTYDEPTNEEKNLIKSVQKNECTITNCQPIEISPVEVKKKAAPKAKLSPRKRRIQEKIKKLQRNLDKLDDAGYETYESEETADINSNAKVDGLKKTLASLTRREVQVMPEDETCSYTFEYESEVAQDIKNKPPTLMLASPAEGVVLIEASRPFAERGVNLNAEQIEANEEEAPKVNLSISPPIQSESSNLTAKKQLKEEQLKEIEELKKRLEALQNEVNEDDENATSETGSPKRRIKVKRRIRVPKVKDSKQKKKKVADTPPKMKKIHKKVRIEKSHSHHHHHHEYEYESEGSKAFAERNIDIESETPQPSTAQSEAIQLLEESSSSQNSSEINRMPKSPLRLLNEELPEDDENEDDENALKVKVVSVEKVPDVDTFCVLFLDSTGDARKTKIIQKGNPKMFNQILSLPLSSNSTKLGILVKKQDLIKGDKLLGTAKTEIDLKRLNQGQEIDKWIQLSSDVGIQTSSQIHIIMSLNKINSQIEVNERDVQLENIDDDDEENDQQSALKPSSFPIPKRNATPVKTKDVSGLFKLDTPPPITNEENVPSSSFISDLVRGKNDGQQMVQIDFNESGSSTCNLNNSLKKRAVALDDSENNDEKKKKIVVLPKKRTIQKIETQNNGNNSNNNNDKDKDPLYIEIKFGSSSTYYDNYTTSQNYKSED